MRVWPLQDAKARFSELVNICLEHGPQFVSRHGRKTVVVMSLDEYEQKVLPRQGLKDFFLSAPRVELNTERLKERGREVEL